MRRRRTPLALNEASIADLRRVLAEKLSPKRLRVTRAFDGSIDLRVLAEAFEGAEDPLEVLRATLREAGHSLPARTLTFAKAPGDVDEDEEQALFAETPIGTPTWGDALLREPADDPRDDRGFGCKVVAFWGLKGGVGRSTALAHVASILGRHMNVLALDLDLDSPGLVATLSEDVSVEGRPRFEDLVRGAANGLSDEDLEAQVGRALRRGKGAAAHVDVLGPAAADAAFVKALLGPLAPSTMYRGGQPALRRLLRAAIHAAEASVALIDTRSGYCDESAMTVLDLADEIVLFASPAPSTFASMSPAIEALERNRRALGRPGLIHLVAGMMPAGQEARGRILDMLQVVAEDARERVSEELATPDEELPPDLVPLTLDYSPRIVENEGQIIPSAAEGYSELAERLVPVEREATILPPEKGWASEVLREARLPVAQAESEEDPKKLAELFTSTRDLHEFVRHDVCLVLGAKGTGKSYLRRMCLEHKDRLAQRSRTKALDTTIFVDGYSEARQGSGASPPIGQDLLRAFEATKSAEWSNVWSALALGRTIARLKVAWSGAELSFGGKRSAEIYRLAEVTTPRDLATAVKKAVRYPLALEEAWIDVDRACAERGQMLTLLFDDLDVVLGDTEENLRGRVKIIRGLLARANTSWISKRHLSAKIFLREDIFRSLKLEEEAKYANRRVVLHWAQEEIWRLVVRAMGVASPRFAQRLEDMQLDRERLEECSPEQLRAALILIWGERMGEGESKTRSAAWVYRRLHDGENRMFPRAALWLLKYALEARRRKGIDEKLPLLDPPALRAAMPEVAEERLTELKRECSAAEQRRIARLKGFDSYQDEKRFLRALKSARDPAPVEALKVFKSLGIIETGSRHEGEATVRIVDLYAFAPSLEIKRLGRQ